ncbi:MAG: general secretion pathway protein GspB [Pseudomonadota bacterium]
MSLILDALRKSDVERSRQQAPQVAGAAAAAEEPEEPGRRWLVPVLALLGVNAVLLAWVLLRPQSPAPVESVAARVPAEPLAQVQAAPANPPPIQQSRVAAAPPQKAEVRSLVEETSALNRFRSATQQPEARASDMLQTPAATTPAPSTAAPAPEPVRTEVAEAVEAAALDLPDASELVDGGIMSREALTLELHYYADAADRRLAFIGGQRVSDGDVLSGGVGVVEIVRNGVVLEHRGRRYFLRRN